MEERKMFCGNCGAQVPDGSAVCPNCGAQMAAKSQAPQMNQAFQNASQSFNAAGAKAKEATKNLDTKKIGMIAAAVVAVVVVFFLLKGIFGGSGLKGTYTDGSTIVTFKGNKMTYSMSSYGMTMEMTVNYKIKKDKLVVDPKSLKFSDETLEVFEDELGYDEDDIDDLIEEYMDDMEEESSVKFKYDKKKKVVKLDGTEYYYAENYKVGPSGKFTSEDDDDVTISFKNGKATFDDDGDKETVTYYCYDNGDDVYVVFYGTEFYESEFYEDYRTTKINVKLINS